MTVDLTKLIGQARAYTENLRVDVLIEILAAALRDLYREVKELELELLRLNAFPDEPDHTANPPGADRRVRAHHVREHLQATSHRVRVVQALQAVLRALDTPYSQVRDVNVLRQLFESPKKTTPKEGPPTLPRYVYELSVLGRKLNEKQREYLTSYASDMTEMECNVRPAVKVETTDEEVPEGWETDDDENDSAESV
jgi:hypothetical protein